MEGRLKSRTLRRLQRKLPSGNVTIHYIQRRPSKATCGKCGAKLNGVPRAFKAELSNMPKSHKRPERPYGGVLCSRCSRIEISNRIRGIFSLSKK